MLCYYFPIQLCMFMVSLVLESITICQSDCAIFSNMPTKISLNRVCAIGQINRLLLLMIIFSDIHTN